jgi:23S rRNA-/tRNA-specific pseudouridylate synthase
VHRLDRTTSGLLVLARTRKAAQDLAKRFNDGSTEQGEVEVSGIQKKFSRVLVDADSLEGKMLTCLFFVCSILL